MRSSSGRLTFACALGLLASGCFYDSRWGEAKRAQQRNAAHATPQALHAEPEAIGEGKGAHAQRVFRVRFHATAAYTAQTIDWSRRARELVDDANGILGPGFEARLEIASVDVWGAADGGQALSGSLDALRTLDDGEGVDWVIGLVGGMSQLTSSFHELGMAPLLSKHLVMRATGKLEEHDAVDSAFDELNDEARARLRRDRRRHRTTAVFLHELGHTLGAVHEQDARSLMYPQYRPDMEAFDEAASSWIRTSLTHRTGHQVLDAPGSFASEVLPSFRAGSNWVPAERDEMVAHLEDLARPHPSPSPTPPDEAPASAPAPVPRLPDDASALSDAERVRMLESLQARAAGDLASAWTIATPLFRKYPAVYSVQDLRCELARTIGLSWDKVRVECELMMQLARDPKRTR